MTSRTFATFEATGFPDESKWTATGSPVAPDGRSVSGTLASGLRVLGFQVSEPVQHSFYGWGFDVTVGEHTQWCLLQGGAPWLLRVEERRLGWSKIFDSGEIKNLQAALRAIDDALKAEPRFSCIQWFTKADYEAGAKNGAHTPL